MFAITLLSLYLFNWGGYTLFFQYQIHQSDKKLVQQLDKHVYSDDDLLEIKVPLHMPYITSWSDYERVDGEIEIKGAYYRYVKRKVSNDTLYLKCIPHTGKSALNESKADYARQAIDAPGQKEKKGAFKKCIIASEYNQPFVQFNIVSPVSSLHLHYRRLVTPGVSAFTGEPYHPPRIHAVSISIL